jgi:protein SCO1
MRIWMIFFFLMSLIMGCEKKMEINPAAPQGGDFTIPSTHGEFSTKSQRGKVLFLSFGFTQCPAICPKTLSHLSQMIKSLPESERKRAQVLFVTVDPTQDTLEVLREHLGKFSDQFVGGNTDEKSLKLIMDKFGATFKKYPGAKPGTNTFSHTTDIFIINQSGHLVDRINYDASVVKLLAAFRGAQEKSPLYAKHRSGRLIKTIAENSSCDLSLGFCRLEGFEISLSPRPLKPENTFKVHVKKIGDSKSTPIEVDIQGVELNMGYIRPTLTASKKDEYEGDFYLPACELSEMQWRARLILKASAGEEALDFYFKTYSSQL